MKFYLEGSATKGASLLRGLFYISYGYELKPFIMRERKKNH